MTADSLLATRTRTRETAFLELYSDTAPRLLAFLRKRVPDDARAEELASEVYLRAWQKLGDLRNRDAAVGWLFRTARNLAHDEARRSRRRPAISLDGMRDDMPAEIDRDPSRSVPLAIEVESLIAGLPNREREVVELRFLGGLRHAEIGAAIGTSEGNAAKLLHRALVRMRSQFEDSLGTGFGKESEENHER